MTNEQGIIDGRNQVVLFHRNFIVIFLTVISTITLIAIPNIPKEWIYYPIFLKFSFILMLVDIVLIPIYTVIRNGKDLKHLDLLLKLNKKDKLYEQFDEVENENNWNEYFSETIVGIFILAIIFILIAIVPFVDFFIYVFSLISRQ